MKPVLVLAGARQVGKTTLARHLAGDGFEYIALDDPILRSDLARVDAASFARRYPAAILDEVQKAPHLIDTVKAIVDSGGPQRYLLLGSSHVLLLERVRESLVGRAQMRQLWPLSSSEILSTSETLAQPAPPPALIRILEEGEDALAELPPVISLHPRGAELSAAFERLLQVGGMPVLWSQAWSDADLREELSTYVTLYLERDLADLARLRDLEPFVRLQRLAAERISTILSFSSLARDAGLAVPTTKSYLRYLELSFQAFLLPPFFANRSKRLVKSPRLHWIDVGIWRAITRRWQGMTGELYESAVVSEALKAIHAFPLDFEPFHLRTYDQREVDLLLVRGDTAVALEIKASTRAHPRDARHLDRLEEVAGLRHVLGLVVYRGRDVVRLGEKIWAVPDALLFGPEAVLPSPSSG